MKKEGTTHAIDHLLHVHDLVVGTLLLVLLVPSRVMVVSHERDKVIERFRLESLCNVVFDSHVACALGQLRSVRVDEER